MKRAHSWAWLQQLVQRAQHGVARCALFRALPRAKRANGDVSLRDHDRAAASRLVRRTSS